MRHDSGNSTPAEMSRFFLPCLRLYSTTHQMGTLDALKLKLTFMHMLPNQDAEVGV